MTRFSGVLWIACLLAVWLTGSGRADEKVDFAKQVAPILAERCVGCHSPGIRKGELSLATIDDAIGNGYLVRGAPEESHLYELIAGVDGQPPEMPKEAAPLTKEQVELIRRWILEGAAWPEGLTIREKSKADASWWSLQPLAAKAKLLDPETAIDNLLAERLQAKGLRRNPTADRRTLIRRATYDLTGLPPTPEEVAAFVGDKDPQAYERLLDRLLASPHYGERWGRHWLDVVRFGESNGFERNVIIDSLWPFRDYVIESINDDKPFDVFIREHLAGDVFATDDPRTSVATAFLVAGPYDDVGNQDAAQAAQIRANTLDEIISATGQAFLGMTIGCARCHDHKFDPITQQDYYGFYATFAAVRHGAVPLATKAEKAKRAAKLTPLNAEKQRLEKAQQSQQAAILKRAKERLPEYRAKWVRPPVDRTGTEERIPPTVAKFVRLVCESQDMNPGGKSGFRIDEFEIWSADSPPRNVALASHGSKASGKSRAIEDFPGAYGPHLAIDGKTGARFIAAGTDLTIELPTATKIDRIVFSSAKGESTPEQRKFAFLAEYRIEVSLDGQQWRTIASGADRKPIDDGPFRDHRLRQLATTPMDRVESSGLAKQLARVKREIAAIPSHPSVWIGKRVAADGQGPFQVFVGGNPQKKGETVQPASLSALSKSMRSNYRLPADAPESQRRLALADWIVDETNPLTPRVLANRVWHYHFGTGIVDTPSDFGYMGGRPTHPKLLDYLAHRLVANGWKLKPLHREIMLSASYRQSSAHQKDAAKVDGDARFLWRFPPRRLSAEEIRDTMLQVSGKLDRRRGGPGFRLYHFMQDNVCTYAPLDKHGPETYRRAVYHQNARASVVDLMTEFDQPDCAFSTPKRAATTTPLQALTMFNHTFTLDMAEALSQRIQKEAGASSTRQVERAYQLCYSRDPTDDESTQCQAFIEQHSLRALCRVLLNTSELIYVR